MAETYTEITCSDDTFTFESQDSDTFKFRARNKANPDLTVDDDWLPYTPEDYIDKVIPPIRGNEKATIGGGRIYQIFGQFTWDADITFTAYLRGKEVDDFLEAKALGAIWELSDFAGNTYKVMFMHEDGFRVESKIKANDVYICKFHFRRAEN